MLLGDSFGNELLGKHLHSPIIYLPGTYMLAQLSHDSRSTSILATYVHHSGVLSFSYSHGDIWEDLLLSHAKQ
jgi:hypothetical protein